jgi:chemotaxis protein methyltransferase CheR
MQSVITTVNLELTRADYDRIRKYVYDQVGINLGEQKMHLVRSRLGKILRQGNYKSFGEYFDVVRNDKSGEELVTLIDAISTNTTHLFREKQHFEFLASTLRNWIREPKMHSLLGGEIRIWSAACSSGEEPYTIAMVLADVLGTSRWKFKILATDISTRVLDLAKQGVYGEQRMAQVPESFRRRFFTKLKSSSSPQYQVSDKLRDTITFERFNLMSKQFPFKKGFDFIFCRNVMIYFDRPTQETLVGKLGALLRHSGFLLIGHSESLNSIKHPLKYVKPTVYQSPS